MLDSGRVIALREKFSNVNVRFFGAMSYAILGITLFFSENVAGAMSDLVDQLVGVRGLAFKFVVVGQGFA